MCRYQPKWVFTFVLFLFGFHQSLCQDLGSIGEQKPINIDGGLQVSLQSYTVKGTDPQQPGFSWYLTGSPTVEFYGVSLPLYFILSNQQRQIQQPFNEFGISPYYKWAKLHLGYFATEHSPFTLAGKRMLGLGAEIKPGKLRFAFAAGRFRKPIQYEANPGQTTTFLLPGAEPSYKQRGFSLKLGLGSERNHIDLLFLKGKDVPEGEIFALGLNTSPAENAIIGLSYRLQPADWLSWKTDLAVSAYTRDQESDILPDSTLPAQNLISRIIEPRFSSQVFSAAESRLTIGNNPFNISLKYRRIDPDYKSMGAYFFQTDIQSFTLAPRFRLADGKGNITGSIGLQKDNLYDARIATTNRVIGSAQVYLQPSDQFGITAQYSNYGITQAALNPNLADTFFIAQVSHQAYLSPRISVGKINKHNISPMLNFYTLQGLEESIGTINSWNLSLSHSTLWTALTLNSQITLLHRTSNQTIGKMKTIGAQLALRKMLFDNRLNANLQTGFFSNRLVEGSTGSLFNLRAGLSYKLFKTHSVQLQLSYRKNNSSESALGNSFSETRAFLNYQLHF